MMKSDNQYDRRRNNKRGIRLRAVKAERRAARSASPVAVDVRDAVVAAPTGVVQAGIVAGIHGGAVTVLLEGETVPSKPSRALIESGVGLAVGDRVTVSRDENLSVVTELHPRTSKLARIRGDRTRRSEFARNEAVLAANVDHAVIVASVVSPPFHPRLVDRYLVVCQYGGIAPVLCLNKCDLMTAVPDLTMYSKVNLPVVWASAQTGQGLDDLRAKLHGSTSVFTGHSGVGKSSLINALLGEDRLATGSVREADGRGRHTTSSSSLLRLDERSYVIDTPGIRSLGLWRMDAVTLRWYFPEFDPYSSSCQFRDCSHVHEPQCAVKRAVESGQIAPARYQSYLRMLDST
jgi:ribosome biogenesis GTPase